ncbi:hypothetical protein FRC06_010209 [Ceratobasidium sp. 370]|nr:hypothetical protein FRC06_010209 [Ceratobasidium sp. 370]
MSQDASDLVTSNAHTMHFYDTGDLILEAQNTLFRIHTARLCEYSEVFSDIFSLPAIGGRGSSTTDTNHRVTIQDDSVVFALLLDVIYQNIEISFISLKQQLQLALLAHKYEMNTIQTTCKICLAARLPRAISTRDFSQASNYEGDPTIAPLVIRVGELLHMPDLLPWAMYYFAIQSEPSNSLLEEDDILLRDSHAAELEAVRAINKRAIKDWNRSVARFMRDYCLAEWWDDEDECWRRTELLDIHKSGFALAQDVTDSLRAMNEAVDSWSQEMCSLCADELTKHANGVMMGVLEHISQGVLQSITPALTAGRASSNWRLRREVAGGRSFLVYSNSTMSWATAAPR